MIFKRGQAWGFDLMIASIIFISGILIFYLYSLNASTETDEKLEALFYQGSLIADNLISEGYPLDWTEDTVTKIGLLSNNRINETKLERFYYLSEQDYGKTKTLLKTRYNYYITFSDQITIQGEVIDKIGQQTKNPKNLIKISRLTIYKEKPVEVHIFLWEI
ncbi:MAG: hypothetical protein AUJ85_01510 [Elusimicrobia bacterium CG1_02_37_114]|nr:MAG: hypothetical protein AUJ85_01510 [Elusimicrobia bacterium CG1_02_37_114]